MKTIDTLVEDILQVVATGGGWDKTVSSYLATRLQDTLDTRLTNATEERKPTLRMSNIGTPCLRKLWYGINQPHTGEVIRPEAKLKFLYGDILEDLLLSLAVAAGHKVEGEQTVLEVEGIKGSRDAVIDGVTVDVKSASSASFAKFKNHNLRGDDPFGYIQQLSSYVYAAKDDPLVTDKKRGAFLVIDKTLGNLCLDVYDFTPEFKDKVTYINAVKATMALPVPPARAFTDEPEGKSGNMKLGLNCSYCDYKQECWPGLRTFVYSRGPVYLTKVKREPDVYESTRSL
jgi:hypothetical protein